VYQQFRGVLVAGENSEYQGTKAVNTQLKMKSRSQGGKTQDSGGLATGGFGEADPGRWTMAWLEDAKNRAAGLFYAESHWHCNSTWQCGLQPGDANNYVLLHPFHWWMATL
jgi:hypothetical protein